MSQREASYPADGPDFQAIFSAAPGPLLVLDPDFTMVAANADRYEATMSTPEQTIGKPLFESFPDNPDDPETEGVRNLTASLERVKATLQPDTMAVQKYDIPLPDGSGFEERYWSPVNTPVVVDGKLRYIIHAVTDVTEFIRSQREGSEQAELARELLDENAQMAADILHRQQQVANASRQLKELDRAKTAFFANVSHELRTPLALILGRTDALESQINPLDEQAYAHIDSIRANAQVLLNQVNHLLSAAKMDVGTPTLEWRDVDMGQLVRRIGGDFDTAFVDSDLRLEIEVPDGSVPFQGDQSRIVEMLGNLLSNALKFTPGGGVVRCSLTPGETIQIEVADSGRGIPVELREAVFERFRQGDSGTDRLFGGTGLGLSNVHDVVRLHHGQIEVGSAPEGGALFRIELPARAPNGTPVSQSEGTEPSAFIEAQAAAAERRNAQATSVTEGTEAASHFERPLVLVAEDNVDLAAFIVETIQPHYRVVHAPDGEVALEMMAKERPSLVMTDIMMPRMDGESLLAAMRADPLLADVPTIVLTARTDVEARVRLLEHGASDFVAKPFVPAELLARVDNAVRQKQIRDDLADSIERRTAERDEFGDLANLDELTGLPNRRGLLDLLSDSTVEARLPGHEVAVLYGDLDHFKAINDELGHVAGDEVLRTVAERLQVAIRRGDIAARVGGDEFVILLFGVANTSGAARIAEKIRLAIAAPMDSLDGLSPHMSIGVCIARAGEHPYETLNRADRAMYQAKKSGRGAVSVDG